MSDFPSETNTGRQVVGHLLDQLRRHPNRVDFTEGEDLRALRAAARLVDDKSREALAGLGALSESRQLLFASLLIADHLLEKPGGAPSADPDLAPRVNALAERLEKLADTLESAVTGA